ncbi:VWA domain-containing protein [Enterococcus sp. 669A]|uniref:VWA domain-containing protein n=1 Tax=Candidatus Enterococcus moelleringii TaxID=2815325 RepID=A0ABS3L9M9_9ENTE|nr:VWA domain-containing protein [Enterococcus sp. 669A]MBO1306305.1 VWA domain-containing protein [Enterococcus sp. 669A]
MGMLNKAEVQRRMCPVIFLLDVSGSMSGAPIGAVNAAIEGVLPELISMNDDNADTEIEVAIMAFESHSRWVTGAGLVNPKDYAWNDLNAGGGTSMGVAFKELEKQLSVSNGFMKRASGSVAPVLFLLTDAAPTDDYKTPLSSLKNNNWYKVAAKVAIGYGDSNDAILAEFTGTPETVLHTNNPQDLKNMIHFVTITSSMVASKVQVAVGKDKGLSNADPNDMTNKVGDALKQMPPKLNNVDPDDSW